MKREGWDYDDLDEDYYYDEISTKNQIAISIGLIKKGIKELKEKKKKKVKEKAKMEVKKKTAKKKIEVKTKHGIKTVSYPALAEFPFSVNPKNYEVNSGNTEVLSVHRVDR